jgi:hypothetical protein
MEAFEASTQSFVVKIWVEDPADDADDVVWRGHITHVVSGERIYFKSLEEIQTFMDRYLASDDGADLFHP